MIKTTTKGIVLGLMVLSGSVANAADVTGNATAKISSAITVTEDTAMAFGTILKDATGATLVLNTVGGVSGAPGGYTLSGSAASAAFTASGDPGAPVSLSFASGSLTGPGTAMALDGFTHNAGAAFDGAGALSFNVGASLTVGANQISGDYAGTYTVTVNYQ